MAISLYQGNNTVSAQPVPAAVGAVAVGRFIAPIAGKTLSRGGAVMAGLLEQWSAITGPSLAAYTMPAKLTKGAPEPDFPDNKPASMLHLKVDPARVLEVQYAIPQLVERINQTLGYKAVAGIRLVQAPVFAGRRPSSPKPLAAKPAPAPAASPAPVSATQVAQPASKLSSALARMAAGVRARQANCQ
jgi:hypothetical protein